MKVFDIRFESMKAERTWPREKPFPSEGNISFSLSLGRVRTVKKDVRRADFTCQIRYSPNVAQMRFEGWVVFEAEHSVAEEVQKEEGDAYRALADAVAGRSSIQATKASETLGVPPPFSVNREPGIEGEKRGIEYA